MSEIAEETERQYRVLDQMLTMHAALRDRYSRRSLVLSIGLLAGAIALNAFVFAGDSVFSSLGFDSARAKTAIGTVSVILLVFSIIEFRVDWAGLGREHRGAAKKLANLKTSYRKFHLKRQEGGSLTADDLSSEYEMVMNGLPPVPERLHNKLKAHHLFKIEESKWISSHPTTPYFVGRMILRWRGTREALSDITRG